MSNGAWAIVTAGASRTAAATQDANGATDAAHGDGFPAGSDDVHLARGADPPHEIGHAAEALIDRQLQEPERSADDADIDPPRFLESSLHCLELAKMRSAISRESMALRRKRQPMIIVRAVLDEAADRERQCVGADIRKRRELDAGLVALPDAVRGLVDDADGGAAERHVLDRPRHDPPRRG